MLGKLQPGERNETPTAGRQVDPTTLRFRKMKDGTLAAHIHTTEFALRSAIGGVRGQNGFTLFRSRRFPGYYGGNGLEIDGTVSRSLDEWDVLYREFFPLPTFRHVSLTFPSDVDPGVLIEDAEDAGFVVSRECYMSIASASRARPLPIGLRVRSIASEDDWARHRDFYHRELLHYDPRSGKAESDLLFNKTRYVSSALGVSWTFLACDDDDVMLSGLGWFFHNRIARLQDVVTDHDHRRKGYATALVSQAMRDALSPGVDALGLCTDVDGGARLLYEALGFEPIANLTSLLRVESDDAGG